MCRRAGNGCAQSGTAMAVLGWRRRGGFEVSTGKGEKREGWDGGNVGLNELMGIEGASNGWLNLANGCCERVC